MWRLNYATGLAHAPEARVTILRLQNYGCLWLGGGCSPAVEHTPHDPEVVSSHPVGAGVLLLLFTHVHLYSVLNQHAMEVHLYFWSEKSVSQNAIKMHIFVHFDKPIRGKSWYIFRGNMMVKLAATLHGSAKIITSSFPLVRTLFMLPHLGHALVCR